MVRLALQEMLHFIRQLQHYSHLEVIDCSWKTLEDFALRKQGDLDSLIEAHRSYLERLINKGLLRGSGAKQVGSHTASFDVT
jgi:gamma-tubulin complex component 3